VRVCTGTKNKRLHPLPPVTGQQAEMISFIDFYKFTMFFYLLAGCFFYRLISTKSYPYTPGKSCFPVGKSSFPVGIPGFPVGKSG
jgi:hypothetical protein